MVKVKVVRHPNHQIKEIELSGHADSGPKGHDLVCAAISAVTIGAINSVEELLDVKLPVTQAEDGGFLRCMVPDHLADGIQEKVQLLLEGMLVSVRNIEEGYGQFIHVKDPEY